MIDSDHRTLPAVMTDDAGWTAMALSGGRTIDIVAAYDGKKLRPLAIIAGPR